MMMFPPANRMRWSQKRSALRLPVPLHTVLSTLLVCLLCLPNTASAETYLNITPWQTVYPIFPGTFEAVGDLAASATVGRNVLLFGGVNLNPPEPARCTYAAAPMNWTDFERYCLAGSGTAVNLFDPVARKISAPLTLPAAQFPLPWAHIPRTWNNATRKFDPLPWVTATLPFAVLGRRAAAVVGSSVFLLPMCFSVPANVVVEAGNATLKRLFTRILKVTVVMDEDVSSFSFSANDPSQVKVQVQVLELRDVSVARYNASCVAQGSKVYVVGGVSLVPGRVIDSASYFDTENEQFNDGDWTLNQQFISPGVAADDSFVYVAGGYLPSATTGDLELMASVLFKHIPSGKTFTSSYPPAPALNSPDVSVVDGLLLVTGTPFVKIFPYPMKPQYPPGWTTVSLENAAVTSGTSFEFFANDKNLSLMIGGGSNPTGTGTNNVISQLGLLSSVPGSWSAGQGVGFVGVHYVRSSHFPSNGSSSSSASSSSSSSSTANTTTTTTTTAPSTLSPSTTTTMAPSSVVLAGADTAGLRDSVFLTGDSIDAHSEPLLSFPDNDGSSATLIAMHPVLVTNYSFYVLLKNGTSSSLFRQCDWGAAGGVCTVRLSWSAHCHDPVVTDVVLGPDTVLNFPEVNATSSTLVAVGPFDAIQPGIHPGSGSAASSSSAGPSSHSSSSGNAPTIFPRRPNVPNPTLTPPPMFFDPSRSDATASVSLLPNADAANTTSFTSPTFVYVCVSMGLVAVQYPEVEANFFVPVNQPRPYVLVGAEGFVTPVSPPPPTAAPLAPSSSPVLNPKLIAIIASIGAVFVLSLFLFACCVYHGACATMCGDPVLLDDDDGTESDDDYDDDSSHAEHGGFVASLLSRKRGGKKHRSQQRRVASPTKGKRNSTTYGAAGNGAESGQGAGSAHQLLDGKYRIIKRLGKGSFSVVYLVERATDLKTFALKYVQISDDTDRQEAMKECEVVRRLQNHPSVIQLFDMFMSYKFDNNVLNGNPNGSNAGAATVGSATGVVSDASPRYFNSFSLAQQQRQQQQQQSAGVTANPGERFLSLVMEFHERGDLGRYVRLRKHDNERVPEGTILSVAYQVLSVLHYMHNMVPPIIHRDLKPENLLLSSVAYDNMAPSFLPIVVTDFGLSRVMDKTFCETGVGSLPYVAPECWQRHYSTKVDVWAVGCILYAMCAKRVEPDNVKVMFSESMHPDFFRTFFDDLRHVYGYSESCALFILSMLEVVPNQRPTAEECLARLKKRSLPMSGASLLNANSRGSPLGSSPTAGATLRNNNNNNNNSPSGSAERMDVHCEFAVSPLHEAQFPAKLLERCGVGPSHNTISSSGNIQGSMHHHHHHQSVSGAGGEPGGGVSRHTSSRSLGAAAGSQLPSTTYSSGKGSDGTTGGGGGMSSELPPPSPSAARPVLTPRRGSSSSNNAVVDVPPLAGSPTTAAAAAPHHHSSVHSAGRNRLTESLNAMPLNAHPYYATAGFSGGASSASTTAAAGTTAPNSRATTPRGGSRSATAAATAVGLPPLAHKPTSAAATAASVASHGEDSSSVAHQTASGALLDPHAVTTTTTTTTTSGQVSPSNVSLPGTPTHRATVASTNLSGAGSSSTSSSGPMVRTAHHAAEQTDVDQGVFSMRPIT